MPSRQQVKRRTVFAIAGVVAVTVLLLLTLGRPWLRERVVDFRLTEHASFIDEQARANDLPAAYLRAIISAESGGNPNAISHKQARGLMQITDAAEQDVLRIHEWEKGDLFEPRYNIRVGTAYLRILADRFSDDLVLTTAAYHQGAARTQKMMDRYPGLAPRMLIEQHANRTTASYVERVMGLSGMNAGPIVDETADNR